MKKEEAINKVNDGVGSIYTKGGCNQSHQSD